MRSFETKNSCKSGKNLKITSYHHDVIICRHDTTVGLFWRRSVSFGVLRPSSTFHGNSMLDFVIMASILYKGLDGKSRDREKFFWILKLMCDIFYIYNITKRKHHKKYGKCFSFTKKAPFILEIFKFLYVLILCFFSCRPLLNL